MYVTYAYKIKVIKARISCYWVGELLATLWRSSTLWTHSHHQPPTQTHYINLFPDSVSSDSDSDRVRKWHDGLESEGLQAADIYTEADLSSGDERRRCWTMLLPDIADHCSE